MSITDEMSTSKPRAISLCSIDGCSKVVEARGYCKAHYRRWERHGDPLGGGISPSTTLKWVMEVAIAYEGNDCLTWPFGKDGAGYGSMHIEGKHIRASRYICAMVHGEPDDPTYHAAHSCGRGHLGCVTKRHLRWASPQENALDKNDHGTMKRGPDINTCKLTPDVVSVVRAIPESSVSNQDIACRLKVSREQIRRIRRGTSWSWLPTTPVEEVIRAALASEGPAE
jgi:hypothetical protein